MYYINLYKEEMLKTYAYVTDRMPSDDCAVIGDAVVWFELSQSRRTKNCANQNWVSYGPNNVEAKFQVIWTPPALEISIGLAPNFWGKNSSNPQISSLNKF
jgi:hypothetical protein